MSTYYEPGRYVCEITQQAMTRASTGTPQFVLKFTVLEQENGGSVSQQYERTSYRAITEKTMPYFKRDLEALGFTGTSLKQLDPNHAEFEDLSGRHCVFECQHRRGMDDVQVFENWNVVWLPKASEAIEGDRVDAASYRKLDVLFGASGGGGGGQAKKSTRDDRLQQGTSRSVMTKDEITDEDVPF